MDHGDLGREQFLLAQAGPAARQAQNDDREIPKTAQIRLTPQAPW
ncbi:hypothetical protein ACIQOV_17050 [Kitasatospora sp. NPDC091257]